MKPSAPTTAEEAEAEPRRSLAVGRRCSLSQSAVPGAEPSRLTWRPRRSPAHWRPALRSTCEFAEVLPYCRPAKLRRTRPLLGPPWALGTLASPRSCCCYRYVASPCFAGDTFRPHHHAPRPPSSLSSALPLSCRPLFSQESLVSRTAWKLRRALGLRGGGSGSGWRASAALPTPSREYSSCGGASLAVGLGDPGLAAVRARGGQWGRGVGGGRIQKRGVPVQVKGSQE